MKRVILIMVTILFLPFANSLFATLSQEQTQPVKDDVINTIVKST